LLDEIKWRIEMKNKKMLAGAILAGGMVCSIQPALATDISIFGDVKLQDTDVEGENSNFALGGVDFFAAQQITDNTFGMVELVFENDGEGFIVDLERLWIRHNFSDQFQLAAGRFHTPIGYWNRNLHHGAILQDTVGRPFFLDFEDGSAGILPVHAIGVWANGIVMPNSEDLKYEVVVSNGPALDSGGGFGPAEAPELDPNNVSDNNGNKSIAARFTYHPEDSDWTLGLFTMQHNIGESGELGMKPTGTTLLGQNISGIDFRWEMDRFDLLTEVFSINNDDEILNNGSHSSLAFYVQGGYKFTDSTKLIYRYSDLSFDSDDTYYMLLGTQEQSHHVVTLRYDFDSYNSLKFEFDKLVGNDVGLDDSNTFRIQWSFLIP
jgi:hypothetical protein